MSIFKKKWRRKKRGVSSGLVFFLTCVRELISLNKQKLRAPKLMNRCALSKWKAAILQAAAAAEGLEGRGGSRVPAGMLAHLRETSPLGVQISE